MQIAASSALANLGRGLPGNSVRIEDSHSHLLRAGAFSAVLHLLQSKSEKVAAELAHLASVCTQDPKHCEMLGAAGVLPLLVPLLERTARTWTASCH